jgi:geranylgeranyl pyrophosphate synthase
VAYQIFDDLLDIQEDSKTDNKEQSLNIVHLLASEMSPSEAKNEATRIARDMLSQVIIECESLPRGAGVPLINLSQQLHATINYEFGK